MYSIGWSGSVMGHLLRFSRSGSIDAGTILSG
jgi:hypothetical protein